MKRDKSMKNHLERREVSSNNHKLLKNALKYIKNIIENSEKITRSKSPRFSSEKKMKYLKVRNGYVSRANDKLSHQTLKSSKTCFEIKGQLAIPLLNYIREKKAIYRVRKVNFSQRSRGDFVSAIKSSRIIKKNIT